MTGIAPHKGIVQYLGSVCSQPFTMGEEGVLCCAGAELQLRHSLQRNVVTDLEVLPLSYSEFCGENLSKQKLTRAVRKLNTNILYLCSSQVQTSFTFVPRRYEPGLCTLY